MAIKFNPLTGNFDFTGSGGGGGASYIDGEVATYADLPLDGSAALNSAWLVRTASGVWPVSRKQAGIYIRTATGGSNRDSDYTYAGTMPDVFSDSQFLLYDNTDTSKNLAFDLGSIATGTTRTLTAPNASGRIQVEGQPIGNTTPAAGTFTTLTANNGTLTASAPVLDLAQTWNASGTTFTGLRVNVTDTASASASMLADFQVGGATRAYLTKDGFFGNANAGINLRATGSFNRISFFSQGATRLLHNNSILLNESDGGYGWVTSGAPSSLSFDTGLFRDAAGVVAIRNAANAQGLNIYNTHTSATNHERLRLAWASNVAILGTEKGSGGGTARGMAFQTDGIERMAIDGSGNITTSGGVQLNSGGVIFNSSGSFGLNFFNDAGLRRDEAGALGQRLGTTAQAFRIYNTSTSSNANFERVNLRWASNEFIIDAQAGGSGTSLRGIKIGSATSSLLGFYGVTPVDQPATVADPAGGGTVDTEARTAINAIIDRLQELGLIA
jgi:hypothetical protein